MYGCRGHRAIACIGLALAGLGALATLIVQNHALTLLKLSLILASLSTLTLLLDSLALLVAYTTLLLLSLASVKLLGAPVLVAVLAPLTPIALRALTKPEVALSGLSTALASTLLLVEGALTLAPYIVAQAILAVLTSRRLHSIVLLAALATIPFGVTPAITASLLSTILVISAGGLIQKVGCPFRVDSNVVFSGSLLASIGVVALALWGWSSLAAGLWILGFLLATSGVLVPTRAPS
ncbi:MAG: hypothetical protein ACO2O2_00690 [Acidilobaceae archaeon]